MKRRIFAVALICSMIMSSAGVVQAGETEEIAPELVAEEMIGETSGEVFLDPLIIPETEIMTDENVIIPDVVEEESPVIDQSAEQDSPAAEEILAEQEIPAEEEIPIIEESLIEEEEDLIAGEPETDLNMLFESAKTELDQVLTVETDTFIRIRTVYAWVSQAFPDAVLTDEELAVLTQRLLENYGIKSCVISGWDETGEQVFWNLVKIDDVFFNLNVSLDRGVADQQQWRGFLKGGTAPFGYVRDAASLSEEFMAGNPVSERDYAVQMPQEEPENADPETYVGEENAGADPEDAAEEQKDEASDDKKDIAENDKKEDAEEAEKKEETEEAEEAEEDEMLQGAVGTLLWPVFSAGSDQPIRNISTPHNYIMSNGQPHHGIDIGAPVGSRWVAAYSGTIYRVYTGCRTNGNGDHSGCNPNHGKYNFSGKYICNNGFGNGVIIQCSINGTTYYIQYAHMNSVASGLAEGQSIQKGTYLGEVGDRGNSYGAHAHFEINQGAPFTNYVNNDPGQGGCQFAYEYSWNCPKIILDKAKSESTSYVTVEGWAFDPDNTGAALEIHVYAYANGQAQFIGKTTANTYRPDVHNVYGCGNYHGFNASFFCPVSGSVEINAAAINIGSGDNAWGVRQAVTIQKDTANPVISNVKVSDISSSGYTVTCDVSDNVGIRKVAFPTWTQDNGQDDIFQNWENTALGTVSNGKATYRVRTSDHGGQTNCTYITHVYAFDLSGNYSGVGQGTYPALEVKVADPVYVTGVKLNKTSQTIVAGKTATLTATVSPSNATNKRVTWTSSNTAVASVNSKGVVTAKKAGTAKITAKAADGSGKKAVCTVTVKAATVAVTGVKLNKTKLTMGNGQSVTLKATVSPSNATNKKVTWKSSNTKLATVSSSGKITTTANANGTVKITATTADGKKVATCTVTVKKPTVSYRTHVQTYGWQKYVKNGAMSGTQGQAKRLEGINIKLSNLPYSGSIVYRTHVQTYGWQGWKKDGAMSGTQGQAKRLEGIQIYLTGELAKHYDVYYRVHAQTYGWMGYAKNGVMAGTSGLAKRLEGINIWLVPKGGKAPGSTTRPYVVGGGGKLPSNPYKGS